MSDNNTDLICISCPMGCRLTLTLPRPAEEIEDESEIAVSGNKCPRGEVYGREEMLRPRRVVTATMATGDALFPRIPVKSSDPVPRRLISGILNELYAVTVPLPAKRGDVLAQIEGISFIATRSIGPG